MVFLDFLQVSILAIILNIHLHTCIVVHLRWLLMVEQELGRILADLSSLISLLPSCFHLREDNTTSASTFLGYNDLNKKLTNHVELKVDAIF